MGTKLDDNASGYVGQPVVQDMREYFRNVLENYLPRVVNSPPNEYMKSRENVGMKTCKAVVGQRIRKLTRRATRGKNVLGDGMR